MILTVRRQQRVLTAMLHSLRDSDPRLVARFTVFSRLTADEEIPRFERVRTGPLGWLARPAGQLRSGGRLIARHFTRPGLRPGKAASWLHAAVFIPLAAVLLLVVTLLLATSGAHARCAAPRAGGQRTASVTAVPLSGAASCTSGQVPGFGHLARGGMFISLWPGTSPPS